MDKTIKKVNQQVKGVSVCIITYNQEKYIEEALQGVLRQKTNFPVELIIGNDASTDKTDKIIRRLTATLPPNFTLQYFNHEINKGMMANWLFIIRHATMPFVAICEGDDYWTDAQKLQLQADTLQSNPEAMIVFHDVEELHTDGSKTLHMEVEPNETKFDIKRLARANFIHTPSVMFRMLPGFKFPDWYHQSPGGDYPLYLLLAKDGEIHRIPKVMAIYRRGIGIHSSGEKTKQWIAVAALRRYLIPHFEDEGVRQNLTLCLIEQYHRIYNADPAYFDRNNLFVEKELVRRNIYLFEELEKLRAQIQGRSKFEKAINKIVGIGKV